MATQTVADADLLAEHLGLDASALTDRQRDAIDSHLSAAVGGLERKLNRRLWRRRFTEVVVLEYGVAPYLKESPLVEVISYAAYGQTPAVLAQPLTPTDWQLAAFNLPLGPLSVTYVAGLDENEEMEVRGAVINRVAPWAAGLLAGVTAGGSAVGGIALERPPVGVKSFSVEGLNVTFDSQSDLQLQALKQATAASASLAWSDEDIDKWGLGRLRRRVAM